MYRESSSFLRRQSSGVLELAFRVSFSVHEKGVCGGLVTCVCFWGCPVNREISSFVRRQSSGVLDLVICVWFWCGGVWDGWLAGYKEMCGWPEGDVWLAIGRGVGWL